MGSSRFHHNQHHQQRISSLPSFPSENEFLKMVGAALRKKTKPQKIVILEHPEKVNSQQCRTLCPHAIIWVSSSRNNVKMM